MTEARRKTAADLDWTDDRFAAEVGNRIHARTTEQPNPDPTRLIGPCRVFEGAQHLIRVGGVLMVANRAAWLSMFRSIDSDPATNMSLSVASLCGVTGCVSVLHLRPMSLSAARRRAAAARPRRRNPAPLKTHCCHGHSLEGVPWYTDPRGHRRRKCRPCSREQTRAYRAPLRGAAGRTAATDVQQLT